MASDNDSYATENSPVDIRCQSVHANEVQAHQQYISIGITKAVSVETDALVIQPTGLVTAVPTSTEWIEGKREEKSGFVLGLIEIGRRVGI